ncbi:MAG: TatD family hydrolase, partial [Candidatus Roizmanbacteria bacterium]|nr:TatD family hydrolase [Candidatus Roizmanbacteria bacterium]
VQVLSLALMFDTHAHLNFSRFKKNADEVIQRANKAGVDYIVIPGTDIESSKKAVEISERYDEIYAAVGIHPHHIYEYVLRHSEEQRDEESRPDKILRSAQDDMRIVEKLLSHPKVVAVGEIGIDRHVYEETKYEQYTIDENFLSAQRELFAQQIRLASKHNKSLIIHNREATADVLEVLQENWDSLLSGRTVFHCCEPNEELLSFAKEHTIYIGVDGDITYDTNKQEFIKRVPLNMLVLETDSPFLLPEPLRSRKEYPNEPKNIKLVASKLSELHGISTEKIADTTMKNALRLFHL